MQPSKEKGEKIHIVTTSMMVMVMVMVMVMIHTQSVGGGSSTVLFSLEFTPSAVPKYLQWHSFHVILYFYITLYLDQKGF